jgi:hypothetical protein
VLAEHQQSLKKIRRNVSSLKRPRTAPPAAMPRSAGASPAVEAPTSPRSKAPSAED